jgi:hypothetical protein
MYGGEDSSHPVGFGGEGAGVDGKQRFEPQTFGGPSIRVHQNRSILGWRGFVKLINV